MGIPEKTDVEDIVPAVRSSSSLRVGKVEDTDDAFEVFKKNDGAVDFRTVGWISTSVIFLKGRYAGGDTNSQLLVGKGGSD